MSLFTTSLSVDDLAAACSGDPGCKGFNTNGKFKNRVNPAWKWKPWPSESLADGIYIKTPQRREEYTINGQTMTDMELSHFEWVLRWTIPNFKMDPKQAIAEYLGAGIWWSLAEGIFDITSSRSWTPWEHNLCYKVDPSDGTLKLMQLDFNEICPTGHVWQAGISGTMVNGHTQEEVEEIAMQMYGGDLKFALAQSAQAAGYPKTLPEFDTIMETTNQDLRQSWLVKSHLVGYKLQGNDIFENCYNHTECWCWGSSMKGVCHQIPNRRYALGPTHTKKSIEDTTILVQSLYDPKYGATFLRDAVGN